MDGGAQVSRWALTKEAGISVLQRPGPADATHTDMAFVCFNLKEQGRGLPSQNQLVALHSYRLLCIKKGKSCVFVPADLFQLFKT